MQQTLEKWSLDKHYKSIHVLGENSSKEESLTPIIIVNQMVETILQTVDITIVKNPNFKVLDSACGTGSFLIAWYEVLSKYHSHEHVVNNMLWGFETNFSYFKANNKYYQFKNVHKESFLETIKLDNMKFDVELFNPPYQQGMFVQFMNKGFELLKEGGVMCAIHPSTYIINKKETTKGKEHVILNNNIEKYKSSVNLVDGNAIFENAGFLTPLSITTIVKTEDPIIDVIYSHLGETKHRTAKSVSEIWMHGNDLAQSIFDLIKSKMETSIEDHLSKKGKRSKYYLNINKVSGHIPKPGAIGNNPDFNCLLYKTDVDSGKYTDKLSTDFEEGDFNYISIDSKKQAKNLYNYLTTKFARFAVSLYKINVQLSRGELKIVPFLDFNESWNDEKCFDYFELTQEERDFVNTYIQDYYSHDFK